MVFVDREYMPFVEVVVVEDIENMIVDYTGKE